MKKRPKRQHQQRKIRARLQWLGVALVFMLTLLAACTPKTETVTVEVTRVVTETVVEEGETVEVTRVVTETVVVEPEVEAIEESPSATGSEGDAGPLPPPPDDGPKVAERRGSTPAADFALETAVTLRGNQTNSTAASQEVSPTTTELINATELQKWCQLATVLYKKRCV